jgi:hypothetical protein
MRSHSESAAREAMGRVQMREEVAADRVAIAALAGAVPDGSLHSLRRQFSVTYQVRVPASVTVSLKRQQGGVRLDQLSGRITASSTNVGIRGSGLSGAVTAKVVNGGVQLDLASIDGDVSASTTNRGVWLDLPSDAKAILEATCVNGSIDVDDRLAVQASESSRRRAVATLNGGVRIRVHESTPSEWLRFHFALD